MHIAQLQVENFRNLNNQLIPLSNQINLITGENGAGKTALLEAIYYLGRQRSFRTAKPKELIKEKHHYFRIIAKTNDPDHQIGLERRLEDNRQLAFFLRIDRITQNSPSKLAKIIPTIAISARSFQLIDSGPQYRRQFMDYGCFQFDDAFLPAWQTYSRALKSRNAALKQKMGRSVTDSFTPMLVDAGQRLHTIRIAYFSEIKPLLSKHLSALSFPYEIQINYSPGWNADEELSVHFDKSYDNDYRLSHTRYGPHRADIRFRVEGGNAENRLSRGQEKNLLLALHLGQIDLIGTHGDTPPLLLFDDIAAELDTEKRNLVLHYLSALNCQMFFSATESNLFAENIRKQAALIRLDKGKIIS